MNRRTGQITIRVRSWIRAHRARLLVAMAGLIAAIVVVSCATVQRAALEPPQIPGATFIGSAACAECHQEIAKHFPTATHAALMAEGKNAVNIGCESCHGPGSLHKEKGGAHHTLINPRRSPEVCFQCHLDKRGQFNLPHTHPVLSGHVSCTDCHDPHKGPAVAGGGTALLTQSETCGRCHTAQRGPFVFEHEAVREGCTTCHDPHGTVNPKMLVTRNQNLCLRCHFQQQTVTGTLLIGGRDHRAFVSRGTCWSAGCHEAVHGSQVGSSLRF